jgi:hypothetical protein
MVIWAAVHTCRTVSDGKGRTSEASIERWGLDGGAVAECADAGDASAGHMPW